MYLFDHRRILSSNQTEEGCDEWPNLPEKLEEKARLSDAIKEHTLVIAEYELKGREGGEWPRSAFQSSLTELDPQAYWRYVRDTLARKETVKSFADYMLRLAAIPTSNAAVERKFSGAALEQTALRNRMKTETLAKLLRVSATQESLDD